jgi:uncharacterized protein (TIGR00661 family)
MKILYAVQGTGNGHVCRASEIVPILKQKAEVDVLISGTQSDITLPFEIKYKLDGLSFVFGKNGGVDLLRTFRKSRLKELLKEVNSLPVNEYDLVISDFEPVSAWACYAVDKPCIALSHQSAVNDKQSPKPKKADVVGAAVLKYYAPYTVRYGFHFQAYAENIFTPVIRQAVRNAPVSDKGHYTVYLPSYSDKKLLSELSRYSEVKWQVFSKHFTHALSTENVQLFPLNDDHFISSMASSRGVLCGAGFETPAEALFLQKKLLVIPMKNQYEQHCNAVALKLLGVPVIKRLKKKHEQVIKEWLAGDTRVKTEFPDETAAIINKLIDMHAQHPARKNDSYGRQLTTGEIKKLTLRKILKKISG